MSAIGLCALCDADPLPGRSVCGPCWEVLQMERKGPRTIPCPSCRSHGRVRHVRASAGICCHCRAVAEGRAVGHTVEWGSRLPEGLRWKLRAGR